MMNNYRWAIAQAIERETQKEKMLVKWCQAGLYREQAEGIFEVLWNAATRQISSNWGFMLDYQHWVEFRLYDGWSSDRIIKVVDSWFR